MVCVVFRWLGQVDDDILAQAINFIHQSDLMTLSSTDGRSMQTESI
jgi:hypothetical protein